MVVARVYHVNLSQHSVFFNITLLWTWTFLATAAKATKLKVYYCSCATAHYNKFLFWRPGDCDPKASEGTQSYIQGELSLFVEC